VDFDAARRQMVETQLQRRQITDRRVLDAMGRVPRHEFVPPDLADVAYTDRPLSIGYGQTISQPYMVALMTQSLAPRPTDRILEIGTGSGYQTAILAELAHHVYTIERIQSLADAAAATLARLGYENVSVYVKDGTLGLPEHAPFDGIMVTAGAPSIPPPLVEQLAEGGRIVCPVGDRFAQSLVVGTLRGGRLEQDHVCSCIFVPLLGDHGWREQ
jgi:protein-L-isoaspartate(D-aspartate) O-methyltransferase